MVRLSRHVGLCLQSSVFPDSPEPDELQLIWLSVSSRQSKVDLELQLLMATLLELPPPVLLMDEFFFPTSLLEFAFEFPHVHPWSWQLALRFSSCVKVCLVFCFWRHMQMKIIALRAKSAEPTMTVMLRDMFGL